MVSNTAAQAGLVSRALLRPSSAPTSFACSERAAQVSAIHEWEMCSCASQPASSTWHGSTLMTRAEGLDF
jgi:hypothetical protein